MERDDLGPPLPEDEADALKAAHSLDVARHYGIDPIRVRAILDRMQEQSRPAPRPGEAEHGPHKYGRLLCSCALVEALEHLPHERALILFETADLRDLFGRRLIHAYLLDKASFLTVSELAEVIEEFLDHLAANEWSLVATGLPSTVLGCSWPAIVLRNLYPTRAVTGYESEDLVGTAEAPSPRDRALTHMPAARRATRRLTYAFWDATSWRICAFEEASLHKGLYKTTARRLEAGRHDFLRLEVAVLRHLAAALRAGDPVRLWTGSLELITAALSAEDAAFYLLIDWLLNGYDIIPRSTGRPMPPKFLPGGLSDLLVFIGHCEKELRIGTMDRTKRLMPNPVLESEAFRSYFQAIDQPWQAELDGALERFVELDAQEAAFWTEFRERVNRAVEGEFYKVVVPPRKVKQKDAPAFEPYVQTFAEWVLTHLELTGVLPILQLSSVIAIPEPTNMIRKDGDVWTIRYAGETVQLSHLKGFDYLAHLLCNPGRAYEVQELDRVIRGNVGAGSAPNGELGLTESDGYRRGGIGDAGDLTDARTISAARARLRELESELRNARASGNTSAAARIEADQAHIKRYLSETVDHRGRPRKAGDPAEKARINVQRLIRRAIESIEAKHSALAKHLETAVHTGAFCVYDPPPNESVAWIR